MKSSPLRELVLGREPQNLVELKQSYLTALHQIVLLGLWRSGFFEKAAFYGGTALSLVHSLDRFSEDLDFSLLVVEETFNLSNYLEGVRKEIIAWGLEPEIVPSDKKSSGIRTAYIKTLTLTSFKSIGIESQMIKNLHRNEKSTVKIEIDTMPPAGFKSEFKYLLNPIPFNLRVMKLSDIYAGKMHALIARKWQDRVKGRDWFDFIWFQRNKITLNLKHLEAKLKKSHHLSEDDELTLLSLEQLLKERIEKIDFEQAKDDVISFVKDPRQLDYWSKELFFQLAEGVKVI